MPLHYACLTQNAQSTSVRVAVSPFGRDKKHNVSFIKMYINTHAAIRSLQRVGTAEQQIQWIYMCLHAKKSEGQCDI